MTHPPRTLPADLPASGRTVTDAPTPAPAPADAAPLDAWQREILARSLGVDAGASHGPGKVLRVKLGYNPNSSSIGSVVSILMWSAAFGAIALNVFAAIVRGEAARLLPADGGHPAPAPPLSSDGHVLAAPSHEPHDADRPEDEGAEA